MTVASPPAHVLAALRWLPGDGSERVGADRATAQALRIARTRGWAARRYLRDHPYARWRITETGRELLAGASDA